MRSGFFLFGTLLLTLSFVSADAAENVEPLRRPITTAVAPGGRVLTANRIGTVSIVDVKESRVVKEIRVGRKLSDLIAIDSDGLFLTTDDEAHDLLLLRYEKGSIEVVARTAVSPYPASVRYATKGRFAVVTSLWSRRVSLVEVQFDPQPSLKIRQAIDVPFAPRCVVILPGEERAIAADAFGGRLGIVDLATGKLLGEREFPGNSVRTLAMGPQGRTIGAVHTMLNPHAHVNKSDIHWGLVMANDLRWMQVESLLDPAREIYAGGKVQPLGVPGRGGGDPSGLAITRSGTILVSLGGVNEVMFGREEDLSLRPIAVGGRPSSIVLSADESLAFTANTTSDSITVLSTTDGKVRSEIPLSPRRERSLVERGEDLFHNARFSHEGWMSCQSCHTDGHTNFGRNDNLSDGGFGAPKAVPTLLGVGDTAPYAWSGKVPDLSAQTRNSIEMTMQTDHEKIADGDAHAIAAYLATLPAPPSVDALRGTTDAAAIARGKTVFAKENCAKCHTPPYYTSTEAVDVGLKDELGRREFNPPSLRGVSQRDVFFHDARAKSLDAVFRTVGHPHDRVWNDDEVNDLVAFLRSL